MKPAASKDIATIYQKARTQGQAFVAFRLPAAKKVTNIIGTVSHSLKDGEKAFVFAPFDPEQKPYFIRSGGALSEMNLFQIDKGIKSTTKKQFTDLVEKIIAEIEAGEYEKIVAARVLAIDKPVSFDPIAFFEKLCSQYVNAFVSLTYIPGVGLWIGASPEVLVSETPNGFTTYSLAGTKDVADDTDWHVKELEEQKIVTDFIHKELKKIVKGEIRIKGPVNHYAGRVRHLLSIFTIPHNGKSIWKQVVKALHPTPAVGGMPQLKAAKFISMHESFDRAFYAGYLGPVNKKGKTDLFVNLRCIQVTDKQLLFYAGCGVTTDSDPEKEWLESERKIDVLRSLL